MNRGDILLSNLFQGEHIMNAKKIFAITVLGLFTLSVLGAIDMVAAQGQGQGGPQEINGNQYAGSLSPGEAHQYRFKNKFAFQVQTNQSMEMDMECDADAVGEREFQLMLNTSNGGEDTKLQIRIQAENSAAGLTNGAKIQARNQNKYQYQNKFMANLSYNGTGTFQARLRIDCSNPDATWAYLDETTDELVTVDSELVDGFLETETDHFSLWTVVEPEAESTIDGYSIVGILGAFGIMGAVLIKKRH
jgi:hypothetical protein